MDDVFRPGTLLLGKYRVESVLGRGGMGVVLRVMHLHLGEELAIKVLSPEVASGPEANARFLREAQSTVRLRGEHIARVSDVGVLPGGAPYIVMEHLRGADLAQEIHQRKWLPPGEAVDYVLQACEALAEAHVLGIVHRDIKPSNLFRTHRPDGSPLIKVLDFGISKAPVSGGVLTRTDITMGTPGYMSPEQMKAARNVDERADIWGLGVVLYEFLNGRPPFQAEAFSAVVFKVATEPPPAMELHIPRALQDVVLRCLAKDRECRFASVAELALALAPFARDQRSALVIVDRTRYILGGGQVGAQVVQELQETGPATTLSGSVRVAASRPLYRRYALAGIVSLLASAALVVVMSLVTSGNSGGIRDDASALVRSVSSPEIASSDASMEGHAESARVEARCVALKTDGNWQALDSCSRELAALRLADQARVFHGLAIKETRNAFFEADFGRALREQDLRSAEALLRRIDGDSVYYAPSQSAFDEIVASILERTKREAQSLADAHDCEALSRYAAKVAATSIASISAAVAAIVCVPGSGKSAGRGGGSIPPGRAIAKGSPCAQVSQVDDMIGQAQNQFNAGFAKAALQLMIKALGCKQEARMYRMAALFACVAHDVTNARIYYEKVPMQFQHAVEQRCQQEGIRLL